MSELRKDPVLGRWVIVASERAVRPTELNISVTDNTDVSKCPFCPGHEKQTPPEILAYHNPGREKDKEGWWVRVIPNKYPALKAFEELTRRGEGMYDQMNGVGAHEVILETPDHFGHIADMQTKMIEDLFWAYKDRILDLRKDNRMKYVLIFKNHGREAGATQAHPHSQLIALPMVPITVNQELEGSREYFHYKERCVFCDMIREEQRSACRIVEENSHFIAIEPYASRSQYETWILPKAHMGHFESITKNEIENLAVIYKDVMGKIKRLLKDPPLNMMIHSTPIQMQQTSHYHWHIEIVPKLTQVAGFEWGTGFYINPVTPEDAAKMLNEA